MAVTAPDWLSKRGGTLRQSGDRLASVVSFGNEPQYFLRPIPAAGKFACEVEQMNNTRRIESSNTYPTADEALRGGLEDLRKLLGW